MYGMLDINNGQQTGGVSPGRGAEANASLISKGVSNIDAIDTKDTIDAIKSRK